jgi:hypothetical protein
MSFPLGNFNPNAPVDPLILAASKAFMLTLPDVNMGNRDGQKWYDASKPYADPDLTRIYLHWSVQGMCAVDAAYNFVITEKDGHYAINHSTDVRKNARSTFDEVNYATHTYHRNTGGIGIALDGMDGATASNFGQDGVTVTGLTYLCAAAAAVAAKYDIDISGLSLDSDPFYGEISTLTHAEAGNLTGAPAAYTPYGPAPIGDVERWDLAAFVPGTVNVDSAKTCGDALRQLAHAYKLELCK